LLVWALFGRAPPIFPRKSWVGATATLDWLGLAQACHGILARMFPIAARNELATEDPSPHAQALGGDPSWAAANRECCRTALGFLTSPRCLPLLMCFRLVLEPFAQMMKALLQRSSAEWREQRLQSFLAEPGQDSQYRLPVVASAEAGECVEFFLHASQLFRSPAGWGCLEIQSKAWQDGALALDTFKMLSRAGGGVLQLVYEEQRVYPFKLFRLLTDGSHPSSSLAHDITQDPDCILDPFSFAFRRRHSTADSLLSSEALAELTCVAQVSETSSVMIETGHARERRRARGRVQTHALGLDTMSAWRVLGMARVAADSSWHRVAQLPRPLRTSAEDHVEDHPRYSRGGGGAWRAFVAHRLAGKQLTGELAAQLSIEYRALPLEELERLWP
jgi:hypothetical protein